VTSHKGAVYTDLTLKQRQQQQLLLLPLLMLLRSAAQLRSDALYTLCYGGV
jgi:hypothetical protein